MANTFQGFAIANNLSESKLDEDAISNLAGSPVGNDIKLFFNNTKNISTLEVTSAEITGPTITFNDPNLFSVFSNKTKISVLSSTYYVKNSDGLTTFQLSTNPNLIDTVTSPPTGRYVRSDEVTQKNLSNYSATRREAGGTSSQTGNNEFFSESVSVLLNYLTPKGLLEQVDANIDAYRFRVSKTLSKTTNFLGSKPLRSTGVVIIKDPDNVNSGGFNDNSPGLFIYDKISNSAIRAFSSNQNPWEGLTSYIQTVSSDITVGRLIVDNTTGGILFELKDPAIKSTVTSSVVRTTFTHKLPITINGELYNICLRLN